MNDNLEKLCAERDFVGGGNPLKVDLVYLWVDGDDPKIKEKRNFWLEKYAKKVVIQASNECRFIENDELRYSLRSVEKFAPWVNNIYIVTDNQVPKWLNTSHPKIHIVDHTEIMPHDALPCFNSEAIELCLANIPDLEEYFIYSNDDMYFTNPTDPSFFFTKEGFPIFRLRHSLKPDEISTCLYFQTIIHSYELIAEKFGVRFTDEPHHSIDPYRKSDFVKCNEIFKEQVDKTIYNKFRMSEDVQRVIYSAYACAVGQGRYKKIVKLDKDLPVLQKLWRILTFDYRKDSIYLDCSVKNFMKKIKKYKPKLICVNDNEKTTNADRKRMRAFLENYFPEKSEFEL